MQALRQKPFNAQNQMKQKTLMLYSSVDGQTLKICNQLKEVFNQHDQELDLQAIDDFDKDITKYDKLVMP